MVKSSLVCFVVLFACGLVVHGYIATDDVGVYELKKGNFSVRLTNWGATIISVVLPDNHGKLVDVALGYDSINDYKNDTPYMGATVGRVANRIGGAQFTLDGIHYKLVANEGKHLLHGGKKGFSDVVWKVKKYQNEGHAPRIIFAYRSYDGKEGFPGDLYVTVGYTLVGDKQLRVTMKAKALNKATPENLVQHTYWNLGKIVSVKGTPYDFLKPRTIGSRINKIPNGYDINYAPEAGAGNKIKKLAVVHDTKSGIVMKLSTNQSGVQFYTSNNLKNVKGKDGFVYQPHAALCLETQAFPDSVNHPNFPSTILNPGETYRHHMVFKFSNSAPNL